MAVNLGAKQYKQVAVKTATRGQILLLLYEAAIQNVKKAMVSLEKKDIAGKGTYIVKTHEIINELINSLNFEVGGNIARDLERLYNFMADQLIKANLENSKEALETVHKLLNTLLEGWKVAVGEVERANVQDRSRG